MYAPLVLGVCVFAIMLYLRVQTWRTKPVQSSPAQRMRSAKALVVALLVFAAVAMRLSFTIADLDGKPREPLTWWEQVLHRY